MRRTLAGLTLAVAAVALAWTLSGTSGDPEDPGAAAPRSADASGVEVTVTPLRLDEEGAVFRVSLDTHTVDLEPDVATGSTLRVGAAEWGPPRWVGESATSHHLAGQLAFTAQGSLGGAMELTIAALPAPATFRWDVGP